MHADREQRADHDHRGDRVGHAHQRRVQRRRHRPHHVVADEHRQHEDRQAEHERIDSFNAVHDATPYAFSWKFGWTTAPSLVSAVALTISSSQFTASALVCLVDQDLDEGEQVARVEARGRGREPPGEIGDADDLDAVDVDDLRRL